MSELARARWARAHDAEVDEDFAPGANLWPDSINPAFHDIPVAIARTAPPEAGRSRIHEIEDLYLDAIRAARVSSRKDVQKDGNLAPGKQEA